MHEKPKQVNQREFVRCVFTGHTHTRTHGERKRANREERTGRQTDTHTSTASVLWKTFPFARAFSRKTETVNFNEI